MTTRQWIIASSAILVLGATVFWFTRDDPTVKQALPAKLQCELPPSSADAPKPGMVWIPEGIFDMGDSVYPEEKPVRNVRVKGFWMDRTEVTNAEFAAFVKATGYVTVAERPVNPQLMANLPEDMCKPGAVVFKVPAQLTHGDDPRQWWQYIPGVNAWGLFDMVSNAWELTADVFVAERSAANSSQGQGLDPDAAQKPPNFKSGTPLARVIKGGSFLCAPNYCMRYRAGSRQPQEEDLAVSHLGFRTIRQP